jgi:co-chaperonin GroES (HSP10)
MSQNLNTIKGNLRPIKNRVLVTDMYFGEQKTKSGLIIKDDDGTTRGIYPRWGKVYAKGPDNKDDYEIGQWVLVEHGRWTRGLSINIGAEDFEVRMVEAESILAMSDEKPSDVYIGNEYSDGQSTDIRPEDFTGGPAI